MELSSPFVQPVLKITRVNGAVLAFCPACTENHWGNEGPFVEPVLKLSSPFLEPVLKITRVNGAVLAFCRACTEDH